MVAGAALWVALSTRTSAEVVINEIHYHPKSKSSPQEFIELHNPDATPAPLSGWKLDGGVKFTFPLGTTIAPGGFLLVAQDPAAVRKEFGQVALGPWKKKLSNRGERLLLRNARDGIMDEVTYGVGFPWPTLPDGGGPSLELLNPALPHKLGTSWRAAQDRPTPGVRNSVFTTQPPPLVSVIAHAPQQPHHETPVRVGARVSAPQGVKSVTLLYQAVEPGHYVRRGDAEYEKNWTALPMHDDGQEGDQTAGDGAFLATIPPQKHRTLVRYRVAVEDGAGQTVRAPQSHEAAPNFAYFVYDGAPAWTGAAQPGKTEPISFPAGLMSTLPTLTLLARQEDVENSQWNGGWNKRKVPGTLVIDGKVYDHILFHNRGQASTYNTGKNKWGFQLARGQEYTPRDQWGRPFAQGRDSITLNACASPWVGSNRGMAGLDEAVSFRAYELAGVPAPRATPTQLRVLTSEAETNPANQYEGDLWGLYLSIEDPDGRFLEERGLADGNVYRAAGGGDKKHQGDGQARDNKDFDTFLGQSRQEQPVEWWRAHLDLPAYYSFRAINCLVGNVDLREAENHYLYHRPDDRWMVLPWDLDMMFIPKSHQSGRVDQERALHLAVLEQEYQNRCRELLDLLAGDATPKGGQFGQIVSEYAAAVHPPPFSAAWPELDQARWSYHPRTNDKGGFYRNPTTGGPDGNWQRVLATPDFAGFCRFVTDFATPARPADKPWKMDDGDPRGYGYGRLAAEAQAAGVPVRPVIRYVGASTFPASGLRFACSTYAGEKPFAAQQWRIAALSTLDPTSTPSTPRLYEINPTWQSPEIGTFAENFQFPAQPLAAGQRYRVRARWKDAVGRWSRWSEAVEFTSGAK